jgi:peptidoglycan/LPS O-acetylase OafA/YrhL
MRLIVLAAELAMSFSALYGGLRLVTDAEGFGLEQSWLAGSPFHDYRIPGLFLLFAIGGGMLASAFAVLRESRWDAVAALGMGVLLAAWLVVETAIIGLQGSQQSLVLGGCAAAAILLIAAGLSAPWPERAEREPADEPAVSTAGPEASRDPSPAS